LRGREPAVSRVAAGLADGTLATTTVTAVELRSGARTAEQLAAVDALLAALPLLPFDDAASRSAAACRRELEARGATMGMGDYLIAGVCLSRGAAETGAAHISERLSEQSGAGAGRLRTTPDARADDMLDATSSPRMP
jgi:predicted nucleic acid-binding protein